MTTPLHPEKTPRPPSGGGPRLDKPLGFAAGAGAGFVLWLIIEVTTQSLALGLLFGLVPGLAIGAALQLTARR